MRTLNFLLALILGVLPALAAAAPRATAPTSVGPAETVSVPELNLPKLGLAGGAALPLWKAQFIGRTIFREIQGQDAIINDPLVAQYVDYLGHRLSSVADGPAEPFHYFVIKTPVINAFAVPGAYIAVYSGLILATRKEDELAGVLAHETAHIVQRHTARQMADATYNNLINIGILLGGIAAAVAGAGVAGVVAAEGGIAQRQINYTRADEMEADRVGIDILARADFNPDGMVDFFEFMQRRYAFNGYNIPEFLSSHPLDLTRVSEAEIRAKNLHVNPEPENPNYALMRARIRVLISDDLAQTLRYFKSRKQSLHDPWYRSAAVYGMVLCLNRLNEGKQALALIKPLAKAHPTNIALQLAEAEALLAAGKTAAGLAALAGYDTLFASNPAVTWAYARALLDAKQPKKTVALLEPGLHDDAYPYDPDFYRLLATAADQTKQAGLAHLAMAHYYAGRGDYDSAIIQLRLGLRLSGLTPMQRSDMEALKKKLKAERKRAKDMGLIQ